MLYYIISFVILRRNAGTNNFNKDSYGVLTIFSRHSLLDPGKMVVMKRVECSHTGGIRENFELRMSGDGDENQP